ncbi:MAG: tetratricopeptide repeat protein [Kiritimatiellaeota bacterium]|nr:tetratricopeptide repeat protein [Kiritimatiellota bacterium]
MSVTTTRIAAVCMIVAATLMSVNGNETHETEISFNAAKALGWEYSKNVNQALKLMIGRRYPEAAALLDKAIAGFERIIADGDKKAEYLSFRTKEEFEAYKKGKRKKVVWLNESYGRAYGLKGFLSVNMRDLEKAKKYLKMQAKVAPVSAGPYNELGFIANKERETKKALSFYKRALAASRRFKSQKSSEPMALRGIGFCLIDLGELEKAKEYYIKAIKLDPSSEVALKELKYIEKLQKKARKQQKKLRK